ncbi:MAG: hypothetical protein DLM58_12770 [Pseudonocardiales bacterium]|nr:MAG: hypothetical protein DLM58_12770 [Pseudonocardiales bacterium]
MSGNRVAEILMYIGALGLVEFALLAVSARQLHGFTTIRLRRKMASPLVRHAPSIAALSAALLVAGALLRV